MTLRSAGGSRRRRRGCLLPALLLIGASVLLSVLLLHFWEYRWYQDWLPEGVDAPTVEYRRSQSLGFGPGGQDTGIIVLRMTEESAVRVTEKGLSYFEDGPGRNAFYDWKATPVAPMWDRQGEHSCDRRPGIGAFLDYGDFRCRLKPEVISEVNQIIHAPGAYYARGRGSRLIIVAPRHRKVVLAWNG